MDTVGVHGSDKSPMLSFVPVTIATVNRSKYGLKSRCLVAQAR
jgi:hypothetical protein